ncbi:archease [Deferribacter autotrophicus]|uniref:Archease n=1 Tax=Deferribacter autotrophicus TaxID=500465 RepID=A0A5A8F601_9BACT|nr:archease [Deferribacter autotrophicus]KAA0258154.1 archease [Deferribacter autotrophicus]
MKKFEIVETTADVGLKVFGENRKDFIENLIAGFYYLVFDENINFDEGLKSNQIVEKDFDDFEDFVYDLLNDLIFYLYVKKSLFKVKILEENRAVFEVYRNSYFIEIEIKAATKHRFCVKEYKGLLEGLIVFDI